MTPEELREREVMQELFDVVSYDETPKDWRDIPELDEDDELRDLGDENSGNFGHAGRPGQRGGSTPRGGAPYKGRVEFKTGLSDDEAKARLGVTKEEFAASMLKGVTIGEDAVAIASVKSLLDTYTAVAINVPGSLKLELTLLPPESPIMKSIGEPNQKTELALDFISTDPSVRNTRAAMSVLGNVFQYAQENDIDRVTFGANIDKGGYAWARMGATARDPQELAKHLTDRLRKAVASSSGTPLSRVSKEEMKSTIAFLKQNNSSPDLPKLVSELRVGRDLLRGAEWRGEFRMSDKPAVARLRRFIR